MEHLPRPHDEGDSATHTAAANPRMTDEDSVCVEEEEKYSAGANRCHTTLLQEKNEVKTWGKHPGVEASLATTGHRNVKL